MGKLVVFFFLFVPPNSCRLYTMVDRSGAERGCLFSCPHLAPPLFTLHTTSGRATNRMLDAVYAARGSCCEFFHTILFSCFLLLGFVHHNYLSGTTAPPNTRFRFLCFMFLFPRFLARLGWKIESDNEFFDNHIQHGTTSRRFYFWPFDCVPVYQESND